MIKFNSSLFTDLPRGIATKFVRLPIQGNGFSLYLIEENEFNMQGLNVVIEAKNRELALETAELIDAAFSVVLAEPGYGYGDDLIINNKEPKNTQILSYSPNIIEALPIAAFASFKQNLIFALYKFRRLYTTFTQ